MIRPYEPKDLAAIMDIGNRAWRGIRAMFRRAYGDELCEILRPHEATSKGEEIRSHCEQHPEWCFVGEENGRVVSFVTFVLDLDRKIGVIGNNAVDPACGLKGKGQEMYRAVLEHFRRQGMRYAQVGTGLDEAHRPARTAYVRAGFDIHHETITYYMKLGGECQHGARGIGRSRQP